MTSTINAFETADLGASAATVRAALDARGVGFGSGKDRSPFLVDPVPRVIGSDDWDLLRRALAQRVRALAAFVSDVYNERKIVTAGVLPERVIETAGHFEPALVGRLPDHFGWVAGLDIVRDGEGRMMVLEDNLRTPSGIAYALAAREAVDAGLPFEPPASRLDPRHTLPLLADTLRSAAPAGVEDPYVVLLSDGPSNSAWYEHRVLAKELGIALVRPEDLTLRGDRLHAGVNAVDVVYRRTDEDRLRTDDGEPTWLADALLEPLLAGTLAVVNPFGTGVADDKLAHAYVEQMIGFYLGEQPLIGSVPTYDLGDPEVLDSVFPRLGELVVKPRSGHGGAGVVVCPRVSPRTRDDARRAVAAEPERFVAQELIELSSEATVCNGRLEQRHVDLRPFVVGVGDKAVTVPVALTRVALSRGSLIVNSSRNGGGKDTWLLA